MTQAATVPEGVLTVAVVRKDDPDLRVLDCEALLNSDLVALRDETWWSGVRAGQLPLEWQGLALRVVPGPRAGPCFRGFSLELSDPRHRYAHRFSIYSLRDTAQRAIARLLKQKVLEADDTVNYYLTALPQAGGNGDPDGSGPGNGKSSGGATAIKVKPRSQGLVLDEASLEKYLAASAPLTAGWATPPDPSDPAEILRHDRPLRARRLGAGLPVRAPREGGRVGGCLDRPAAPRHGLQRGLHARRVGD